jgi:tetratricopeptide (TPR) repeat protein
MRNALAVSTALTASLALAFALVFGAAGARAESAKREEAKKEASAREAFRDGVSYYEKGRFADALVAFKQAYALRPSYKILFNIGQVQAMLGHNEAALEAFEGYLAEGRAEIKDRRLKELEREMARLAALVGELTIDGPSGAELWVDGERRGTLPLAGPLRLDAQEHLIVVRTGEALVCEKREMVIGAQAIVSKCEPPPQTSPEAPSVALALAPKGPAAPSVEASMKNVFLDEVAPWTAAGLGVASLAAAVVCAVKAKSLNGELNDACPGGDCPASRADDVDRLPKLAGAADGLFVATAVLGAAAITLFVAPWRDRKKEGGTP